MNCKMLNSILKIGKEKIIFISIFIYGLIMMFLIPTWQIPDESTYLWMIGMSIENEEFSEILMNSVGIHNDDIIFDYSEKIDIDEQERAMLKKPDYNKKDVMPKGMNLSIIKHLPATMGILLGILFGLPTYWVLQMGELASLVFYVLICYIALKLMPIKKELLAMFMFVPIVIQQAGSLSYDAVLIPLCFLFISYVLNLKYTKDNISIKDFVILILIWAVISYIKLPYCFLGLLVFVLPLEKICIQLKEIKINGDVIKKWRILALLMLSIIMLSVIFVLKSNFWIQLVLTVFAEWKIVIYLLWQTIETWYEFLIVSSIGNFGWLDTPICFGIAIITYIAFLIVSLFNSGNDKKNIIKKWDAFVIWGTAVVLTFFSSIALINHTIMVTLYGSESATETYNLREALYQIPYIGGLQGRYFIPFLILFFLPLPQIKRINKKRMFIIIAIFEGLYLAYIVGLLLNRYWIY